jgi:DNA-binding transcriptional ArsR family regulator
MTTPFEELAQLDRVVHEPIRLAILTALSACEKAEFLFLQRITGVTKGNLSSHLGKLEAAGLVTIEKRFVGKKTQTMVSLSAAGRETIEDYWAAMAELKASAGRWRPSLQSLPTLVPST